MTLTLDNQLELHRMMMLIRLFEEALEEMFSRGLLHGTMHLSIGQEASAAGACLALDKEDLITSTHRGHGHCLGKGADPFKMFAELLGREDGYCRGRGGSMHIADLSNGNLGANGIVAGSLTISVGAALSFQMQKKDNVVLGNKEWIPSIISGFLRTTTSNELDSASLLLICSNLGCSGSCDLFCVFCWLTLGNNFVFDLVFLFFVVFFF